LTTISVTAVGVGLAGSEGNGRISTKQGIYR
jgi:hypothetical protein